jgi:formate hydrogenlyase subunit 6/NADH:ubiquinone oxidoreductase subunit I
MKRPGMMIREVVGSAMRKPLTVRYPFVKVQMPKKFRGKLAFNPTVCIGCKICEKDCPAAAITIRKIADKKFECDIDLGKCIYCAQCADSCPRKALTTTEDFELAQLSRGKLKVVYTGQADGKPTIGSSNAPVIEPPPAPPPKPAAPAAAKPAPPQAPAAAVPAAPAAPAPAKPADPAKPA